jgi:hypothetical protein
MNVEEDSHQLKTFDFLFDDLNETVRQMSPTQVWKNEINLYQNLPRADGKSNPLIWWKAHCDQLPNLCMIFLKYFFSGFFVFRFLHVTTNLFSKIG